MAFSRALQRVLDTDLASGRPLKSDFRLLDVLSEGPGHRFGLWETSEIGFWPLGALWEGPGGWFWPPESLWDGVLASGSPLGGSWRLVLPSGRVLEAVLPSGRPDLGSGRPDLGSGRPDLGSETILGPLFGGFLRVFL